MKNPLVGISWLLENIENPDLVLLDASLKKTMSGSDADADSKIPGSRYFDLENHFSDVENSLPHMMPSPEQFTFEARRLGISDNSIVVVYDNIGMYVSPRVWWMFLAMGHQQVFVLDGGLPEWKKAGHPVVSSYLTAKNTGNFSADYKPNLIVAKDRVLDAIRYQSATIIDARSAERFRGTAPEPRKGLRSGHMHDAINIPFGEVLNGNILAGENDLKHTFESIPDKKTPLIFSCGSGVTACIDALAATVAGYENIAVYDGSWSEWGADLSCPVV